MQERIFRKAALERLSSPEQLDQLITITSRRAWLILVALASIVLAGVGWLLFGSVVTTVSAPAVIGEVGTFHIAAASQGRVNTILVSLDEQVAVGDELLRLVDDTQTAFTVTSPIDGKVISLPLAIGQFVTQGDALIGVDTEPDTVYSVVLFLPMSQANQVTPGMAVYLEVEGLDAGTYGSLRGMITQIDSLPATERKLVEQFGSSRFASFALEDQSNIAVQIRLAEPGQSAAYSRLRLGTTASGTIILRQTSPLRLLFGQQAIDAGTPLATTPLTEVPAS